MEIAAGQTLKFPHLYRCGHIEGWFFVFHDRGELWHFRIFIDAATLKDAKHRHKQQRAHRHFRIFIDAATLKENHASRSRKMKKVISASL